MERFLGWPARCHFDASVDVKQIGDSLDLDSGRLRPGAPGEFDGGTIVCRLVRRRVD